MSRWIGYAKAGKEQDVAEALHAEGIEAEVALSIIMQRRGKDRHPRPYDVPAFPNFIFIDCPDTRFPRMAQVKFLAHSFIAVSDRAYAADVAPILRRIQRDTDKTRQRIERGEAIAEFKPGDLLKIIRGPLAGQVATFKAAIDGATVLDRKIRAEVPMFGTTRLASLDPLDVRRG